MTDTHGRAAHAASATHRRPHFPWGWAGPHIYEGNNQRSARERPRRRRLALPAHPLSALPGSPYIVHTTRYTCCNEKLGDRPLARGWQVPSPAGSPRANLSAAQVFDLFSGFSSRATDMSIIDDWFGSAKDDSGRKRGGKKKKSANDCRNEHGDGRCVRACGLACRVLKQQPSRQRLVPLQSLPAELHALPNPRRVLPPARTRVQASNTVPAAIATQLQDAAMITQVHCS